MDPRRNRGRRRGRGRGAPRRGNQPRNPAGHNKAGRDPLFFLPRQLSLSRHLQEPVAPPLRYIKAKTVAIMGPSGAGKTTWLTRFTDAKRFTDAESYDNSVCGAICGAKVYPIDLISNMGTFRVNALDVPDNMRPELLDPLLYGVDAVVMMFDLHSPDPFPGIRFRHAYIKSLKNLGDKPVLLCGNKVDKANESGLQRASSASRFARREKFKWYYQISALANHRIIEPFLYAAQLAEGLTDMDLYLTSQPNLAPHDEVMHHLEEQERVEYAIANILCGVDNVRYSLKWQSAFVKGKKEKCVNFFVEDECEEDVV